MPKNHRFYLRLAMVLVTAVAVGLFLYVTANYVNVDFRLYPRDAQSLDLTGQKLTAAHFDKLQRKLPDCDITWDVPLSGGVQSSALEEITVDTLTEGDVAALAYFPALKQVDAQGCTDYDSLLKAVKAYPAVAFQYAVQLGGDSFRQGVREIEVRNVPEGELPRLGCLTQLESVICAGGDDADALMRWCHDAGLAFSIRVGNQVFEEDSRSIQAAGATGEQLKLILLLPKVKNVSLTQPQATAQELVHLRDSLDKVSWEISLCGVLCSSLDTELDLSEGEVTLEEIREKAAYFPDAESLYLGDCGIGNESLAAFREEMREEIKVVWQVTLGKKLTARTDDKSFMPVREHVYYFNDEEAYNLRYCEEMEAIDIGHMSIHNIDFVEFMPNLTYLILAHTQLNYIEPIAACKKLKFLELDWSPLRDLSPLVGCTALEDLNLGQTFASFEPVKEMTWLKNLWVINCNQGVAYRMQQALPETKVQGSGNATVASGWRRLPNYYAMRDALNMYYMHWA